MHHSPALLLTLVLTAPRLAAAGCTYPAPAAIPDGASASRSDMRGAQQAVQAYLGRMEDYLDCLDRAASELPVEQQTAEAKALNAKRHNAAVEAMERLATRFNEQVRAFKAAGGS